MCLDAESNLLQPDYLSPVIGDIIKLVEEWQATQQPIVNFYQVFNFILAQDTLEFIEAIVRGKFKIDIIEYIMNKVSRTKGSPEIIIFNKYFLRWYIYSIDITLNAFISYSKLKTTYFI